MGGSAEVPTPRPFEMEADVTPNNYPGKRLCFTTFFLLFFFRFNSALSL